MAALEIQTLKMAGVPDLLSEANHRIANNLAVLMSAVQLQASTVTKGPSMLDRDAVNAILRDIAGKISSVGQLHRLLSRDPGVSQIDLGNFLIECCTAMISSLSLGDSVGLVQQLSTQCHVSPEQAQPLGLILSEVMMNAVKYAHPTGIPVQIHINCDRKPDGSVVIEIGDDGVGLPDGFDPAKDGGTGFRLIRSLASTLGADLKIESGCLGLSFCLSMPASMCAPMQPKAAATH